MKLSRLASALTLSLISVTSVNAAKYRVVELPVDDLGINSFAQDINQRGDVTVIVDTPFNPPIDVDLINFESPSLLSLTNADGAAVGNINNEDLAILAAYIKSFNPNGGVETFNYAVQMLADYQSYISNERESELLQAFDKVEVDLEGLSQSVNNRVTGINNALATVGNSAAPFEKIRYRNENGDIIFYMGQEHYTRGYLQINNAVFDVLPPEDFLGGFSNANDINNSFEVAGVASVEVSESFELAGEACEDEDQRNDVPYEICVRNLFRTYQANYNANLRGFRLPADLAFKRRAMIWQFNASGDLLESRELGTLIDKEFEDDKYYSSSAKAINDNGIAVGTSNAFFADNPNNVIVNVAAVFDGDEVVGFINDQEYPQSTAEDINNNDIVVGYGTKIINGTSRTKFFVHDYRGEVTEFPSDFFNSSSSVANAINDNGLVVGQGEVETNLSGARRSEGFIYDIDTKEFTNINDMLSCNSPYTIIQANDINERDEIAATAVVYRESYDLAGDIALDDRGNTIYENATVAVKLVPIPGGTIDDCQLQQDKLERKGGSPLWLLPLIGLALCRRFWRN